MMPDQGENSGGMSMTSMEEASTMMHEMYTTLQRSGFTSGEALSIVTNMITQVMIEGTRAGMFGPGRE